MADKQITELPNADTLDGFETVHVVQSGNSRKMSLSELSTIIGSTPGPDGKSAYEVAVDEGFEGTVEEWLESLVGPEGPAGADGVDGTDGGQGPQGVPGPSVVPDEYGIFDEAKVSDISTADVEWNMLIIAGGDERIDPNTPAALAGDMSGHLVRYETGGAWFDLGPIVGVAGPTGATGNNGADGVDGEKGDQGDPGPLNFNVFIGHPTGIVAGGYPVTYYVPRTATITKAAYLSEDSVIFSVDVNGSPVMSETSTAVKTVDDVSIPLAAGDEIIINIVSGDSLYFGLTLSEV